MFPLFGRHHFARLGLSNLGEGHNLIEIGFIECQNLCRFWTLVGIMFPFLAILIVCISSSNLIFLNKRFVKSLSLCKFLQVLNISGNNVPLFGRRHFARLGLTNLQRVAASRCGLVQIDSLAFVSLTNLVELDLSLNDLSEVNRIIFRFIHGFFCLSDKYAKSLSLTIRFSHTFQFKQLYFRYFVHIKSSENQTFEWSTQRIFIKMLLQEIIELLTN